MKRIPFILLLLVAALPAIAQRTTIIKKEQIEHAFIYREGDTFYGAIIGATSEILAASITSNASGMITLPLWAAKPTEIATAGRIVYVTAIDPIIAGIYVQTATEWIRIGGGISSTTDVVPHASGDIALDYSDNAAANIRDITFTLDIEAGNSNIALNQSAGSVEILGLATETVRHVAGLIQLSTSSDSANRIEEVTYTVPTDTPTNTPTATPTPTVTSTITPTPTMDVDARYITTEDGTAGVEIGDGTFDLQLAGAGIVSASNQSIVIHLPEYVAGINANASGNINVDQSVSNSIIDITYEVLLTSSVVTEASKAFVAFIDASNNIIDATGRSPAWLQPTPPVRQVVKVEDNRLIINTWLDPTATPTITPTPTMSTYESYEELERVSGNTYRSAYEINYIDRVTYKDVPTTNNALDYHELIVPRDKYVQSATNEVTLQWTPRSINSISGGPVVYKLYIYYLYRAFSP